VRGRQRLLPRPHGDPSQLRLRRGVRPRRR
jgi:hypothetical protein